MALVNVLDKWLVTFKGTLCGQTILNTFWYELTEKDGLASEAQATATIRAALIPVGLLRSKFLGCCPNNYTLDETWIQKIHPDRIFKHVFADGLNGTSGVDAPTANLAAVIVRRAELAQRRSVSTLHIPLPDPSVVAVDGEITDPGHLANLNALRLEMMAPLLGAGAPPVARFDPVVFNPKPKPPLVPLNGRIIIQTVVDTQVRVMRRRTVGLGI